MESWTYINHDNINRVKYNAALVRNVNQNSLYTQDFVWDALHPGWDILISGDYKLVVPIPFMYIFFMRTFEFSKSKRILAYVFKIT